MLFIKDLRQSAGMTRIEFCKYFHIPYSTLVKWEEGVLKCPSYLLLLIEYKLKKEGLINEGNS